MERGSLVLFGLVLDLAMEVLDFIIQLAYSIAVKLVYVWECPTNVIRGLSKVLRDIRWLKLGDVVGYVLALPPMLDFIQSTQCVDLVK